MANNKNEEGRATTSQTAPQPNAEIRHKSKPSLTLSNDTHHFIQQKFLSPQKFNNS